MYAVVNIAGQQFKVEKTQKIFVHRLDANEGSKVTFDKVLLMDNSGKINIGDPIIKGANITAKVIEHLKGDKVVVFKKKRRKGYKVKNGHRQHLTKLEILSINEKGSKKTSVKETEKKIDLEKKRQATKKAATKKAATTKAATTKAAATKAATTKAATKKAATKKVATNKKSD